MRYAQVEGGQKLHLVCEAGESWNDGPVMRKGYFGTPICGRDASHGYRMTINIPLANACKNCLRVYAAFYGRQAESAS